MSNSLHKSCFVRHHHICACMEVLSSRWKTSRIYWLQISSSTTYYTYSSWTCIHACIHTYKNLFCYEKKIPCTYMALATLMVNNVGHVVHGCTTDSSIVWRKISTVLMTAHKKIWKMNKPSAWWESSGW